MSVRITESELWAAIDEARAKLAVHRESILPAGSVSRVLFAKQYDLSPRQARSQLEEMVAAGIMESQVITYQGHRTCIYWPKKTKEVLSCPQRKKGSRAVGGVRDGKNRPSAS